MDAQCNGLRRQVADVGAASSAEDEQDVTLKSIEVNTALAEAPSHVSCRQDELHEVAHKRRGRQRNTGGGDLGDIAKFLIADGPWPAPGGADGHVAADEHAGYGAAGLERAARAGRGGAAALDGHEPRPGKLTREAGHGARVEASEGEGSLNRH